MSAAETRSVRIHYRTAKFTGAEDGSPAPVFEDVVRDILKSPFGDDWEARSCRIREGSLDEAFINETDLDGRGVFLEIFHIDPRRDLPFLKKEKAKAKTASVLKRPVPTDENAMGDAAYLLAIGNHIAAIEPLALKPGALTNYFNAFFQKAERLQPGETWKLVPKVQSKGATWKRTRGLTGIEVKPHARLAGEGPSETPVVKGKRQQLSKQTEARISEGGRIEKLFEILSAEGADLGNLREAMSLDLGLEAKVIFQVRRNNRRTEAQLETDDLSQAIASLEEHNDVALVSPDGKDRNGVSTLMEPAEVALSDGTVSLQHVSLALSAALMKWAGKSIIDLTGQ